MIFGEFSLLAKLSAIFSDIKIQHTVFALPFAVMSAFIAAGGLPETKKLAWVVACMVGARSAAMAFNRIIDARFDAKTRVLRVEQYLQDASMRVATGYF